MCVFRVHHVCWLALQLLDQSVQQRRIAALGAEAPPVASDHNTSHMIALIENVQPPWLLLLQHETLVYFLIAL